MNYRCPKAKNKAIVSLVICAGRKERKHYGCVTCRVPAQKRRERKELDQRVYAIEIIRGAIKVSRKKREWAFKFMGVTA